MSAQPQGRGPVTRESKLALIVGFSVMLLVGVLISDHLSRARTDGEAMLPTQQTINERPQQLALTPLTDTTSDEAPTLPDPEPSPKPIDQGTRLASNDPVVLNHSWWSSPSTGTEQQQVLADEAEPLPDPQDSALARMMETGANIMDRMWNASPPAAAQLTSERAAETEAARSRPAPDLATRPARTLPVGTHTVVRGDTLFSLAATYMGSGHRWREIKDLNQAVLKGSDQLGLGMELRIPGAPTDEPSTRPAPQRTPGERTYEVRPGDTLGEICQRELGTVKRMGALLAANSDKIDDADDIRVGMVLVLPGA